MAGGQRGASGNHLPDRIGIAILAKVFPPELVDRVVDEAEVREQRKRILPARVVVYLLLVMVMFPGSGYAQVWDKLVQGMEWARWFRGRTALGTQPSPAAITLARQRLGWQVMQQLLAAAARPSAAEERGIARVAGMRLIAVDGICLESAGHQGERDRIRLSGQPRRAGTIPAGPRRRLGRVRDLGGARGRAGAAGYRRAAAGPQAADEPCAAATCCWPAATSCRTACWRMCWQPRRMYCGGRGVVWTCRCWSCFLTVRTCLALPTRRRSAGCGARVAILLPSPAFRSGSSSTRPPAGTAACSLKPSPWSPTSPIRRCCQRIKLWAPTPGAGS